MLEIFRDGEMIPQSGSLHGRGQMGEGLDAGALLSAPTQVRTCHLLAL